MKKWMILSAILSVVGLSVLSGCTTTHRRILSQAEMAHYNLHGVVNEAPICPTQYDSVTRTSKIIGACEKVSCEKENGRLICTVERK